MDKVTGEINIEQVYGLANKYSGSLLKKFNIAESRYAPEDLVSDFIVKFLSSDFLEKFDPQVRSLNSYVYSGLRFLVITHLRKKSTINEGTSLDAVMNNETNFTLESVLAAPARDYVSDMLIEEIIAKVSQEAFGHEVTFDFCGKQYPSTIKSLCELFLAGFSKEELSQIYKVTAARIGQLIRDGFLSLPDNMVRELGMN